MVQGMKFKEDEFIVRELTEDMASGVKLLKLLEVVVGSSGSGAGSGAGRKVPKPEKPNNRQQKVLNVTKALRFLEGMLREPLPAVQAEEIVDGNLVKVGDVVLCWR